MGDCYATAPANTGNRDRDERHDLRYPVLLGDYDAFTRDISASGAYFETDHPEIVVDQRISFVVMLPPDAAAQPYVWCEGRVVRVDISQGREQVGVGVAFEHCRHAHF